MSRVRLIIGQAVVLGLFLLVWLLTGSSAQKPDSDRAKWSIPAGEVLDLQISMRNLARFRRQRQKAIATGHLEPEDPWAKVLVYGKNGPMEGKIRLKGDNPDHLQGEKWSFRIALKGEGAWHGLRTFSLQNPPTRRYLDEWLLHQVMREEGLLTTRYDFVRLRINGADMGIYAIEEHFTPELLAWNQRREGPIMKFGEGGFWQIHSAKFYEEGRIADAYPHYPAMEIVPFQDEKTLGDPKLREQFSVGQTLLNQYQQVNRPVGEVLAVKKMARGLAILDLFGAWHALYPHNMRFALNPHTSRLEPVWYDGFNGPNRIRYNFEPYLGAGGPPEADMGLGFEPMLRVLWEDSVFVAEYYGVLERVCGEAYVRGLQTRWGGEIKVREELLREEFLWYGFDWEWVEGRIGLIGT